MSIYAYIYDHTWVKTNVMHSVYGPTWSQVGMFDGARVCFVLLSFVEECCLTGMPIQLCLDDEKITPF